LGEEEDVPSGFASLLLNLEEVGILCTFEFGKQMNFV
jgi:hypothetical protein